MCQEGSKQTALKSLFLSRCSTPCNRKQRHLQKAAAHKHHSGREHSVRAGVPLPQKVLLKRAPARTEKKRDTKRQKRVKNISAEKDAAFVKDAFPCTLRVSTQLFALGCESRFARSGNCAKKRTRTRIRHWVNYRVHENQSSARPVQMQCRPVTTRWQQALATKAFPSLCTPRPWVPGEVTGLLGGNLFLCSPGTPSSSLGTSQHFSHLLSGSRDAPGVFKNLF